MKFLILIITAFYLYSCAGDSEKTINPHTVKAQGGVDIGNMSSSVPQTNAYFDLFGKWKAKVEGNLLIMENESLSKIEARKVILDGLDNLNTEELQKKLLEKHPGRTYKPVNYNGLEGLRTEVSSTEQTKVLEYYLISEGKDLIHIVADLNNADDGFTEGEQIINTVRVKFIGVAYKDTEATTINLHHQRDNVKYKYSFSKACFESEICDGSMFELRDYNLSVEGNIVELGPESTIPFDSIKVDGEFLTAPESKFSIADIYADDRGQSSLRIKDGYNYLIRVDNGPENGLILKLNVTGELAGENTEFKYQKLVAVKPESKP